MGSSSSSASSELIVAKPPPSKPIPAGKTRICMAAFPAAAHGVHVSNAIAAQFPEEYETWYYVSPKDEYYAYLKRWDSVPFPDHLKGHQTSPFIWLERAGAEHKEQIDVVQLIGPSEKLGEWALQQPCLAANDEVHAAATSVTGVWCKVTEIFITPVSTADVSP